MSIEKRTTTRGPRYDVRLRDPNGKTYNRTFATRKEAERFQRNELSARDRGDWIDPRSKKRTFTDVAEEWLDSNPAKRSSTMGRDRVALAEHVLPVLGAKRIGAIVPRDVQQLIATMGKRLAPATVRRNFGVARAVFIYAADRGYIAKSPCRTVKLPTVPRASVHVFTPQELAVLAEAMPAEYSPMVWLGAVLGLRWGEAAALQVCDVDLLGRELHVRRTITRDEHGAGRIGAPKSEAGRRTLSLPQPLVDVLAAHLKLRGLTAADGDALVFAAPKGGLLNATNWRRQVWHPAAVAAGVGVLERRNKRVVYDGAVFHDLRRTSATELAVSGVDVKTAQTRLGHTSVRLTLELYAQAVPAAEVAAADLLGSRLMAPPKVS